MVLPRCSEYRKSLTPFPEAVLAVSCSEDNPIDKLRTLFDPPPPIFKEENLDIDIPLYRLLVVDGANAAAVAKAESVFTSIQAAYGKNTCFQITLNSNAGADPAGPDSVPDLWREYVVTGYNGSDVPPPPTGRLVDQSTPPAPQLELANDTDPLTTDNHPLGLTAGAVATPSPVPSTPQLGSNLSVSDVSGVKKAVSTLGNSLLNILEGRLRDLNQLLNGRKGLRFMFAKKFLGVSTAKQTSPQPPGSPQGAGSYAAVSPEAQMRRVGDLSLMLGDYELAISTFHSVKKDFNNDRAWKSFAAAQEMLAVALYLSDSPRNDYFRYFEGAIMTYLTKCNALIYATRATIFAVEYLKQRGKLAEAASLLIRMTTEEVRLSLLFLAALFGAGPHAHKKKTVGARACERERYIYIYKERQIAIRELDLKITSCLPSLTDCYCFGYLLDWYTE